MLRFKRVDQGRIVGNPKARLVLTAWFIRSAAVTGNVDLPVKNAAFLVLILILVVLKEERGDLQKDASGLFA